MIANDVDAVEEEAVVSISLSNLVQQVRCVNLRTIDFVAGRR